VTGGRNQFIFAYGSLAGADGSPVRRMPGYRRVLGVAMDNRLDIPGYKFYRRPDGSRPAVHVAFADLIAAPGGPPVNGVCRRVERAELVALDARERNYDRVDVSDRLEDPPGRTWAYEGSAAGRERLARGKASGDAVVAAAYLEVVEAAFLQALGPAEWEAFRRSTDFGGVPVQVLQRVDLRGG